MRIYRLWALHSWRRRAGPGTRHDGRAPRFADPTQHRTDRGGWTIPGGHVERDETAEQAVIREVEEETGLRCSMVGLAGYRNRADADMNTSYVVFLLEAIGGAPYLEPTSETAQVGFYTLDQIKEIPRLTPLSREFAVAALTDRLKILYPKSMPNWNDLPPFTMFM